MEKRTYGAPRLVDWVAQIKTGSATVRVHFTGGALTTYGVTPAEYTTANPFIQKVIENSTYFKEGRITLLRKTDIGEEPPKLKKPKTVAAPATPVPEPKAKAEEMPTPPPTVEAEQEQPVKEPVAEVEADNTDTSGLIKVEVTCLQDAHAYLQENFNISSYKVRSYEAAQRAAWEHGVQFVSAKFAPITGGESRE